MNELRMRLNKAGETILEQRQGKEWEGVPTLLNDNLEALDLPVGKPPSFFLFHVDSYTLPDIKTRESVLERETYMIPLMAISKIIDRKDYVLIGNKTDGYFRLRLTHVEAIKLIVSLANKFRLIEVGPEGDIIES